MLTRRLYVGHTWLIEFYRVDTDCRKACRILRGGAARHVSGLFDTTIAQAVFWGSNGCS